MWEEGREEGGGRWSGEEKKRSRSYGQTVLFKDVTVIGLLQGGLRETTEHNVQTAAHVICSGANLIPGALKFYF